jgi:osmoprotectant transport system substrate-binding protein
MRHFVTGLAAAAAAVLTLTACGGSSDPLAGGGGESAPAPNDVIRIGSANFTENQLLAEIYAAALEAEGVQVEKELNIGSRETYFPGLQDGSIDLIPEYTGNLLQYLDEDTIATASREVYDQVVANLPEGLEVLEMSAAEDKDAVVVTRETADRLQVRSIVDLAPRCDELVFGGPPEFAERPYGLPGLERLYGCTFSSFRRLDAGGPLTVAALEDGTVQAADLFTTDAAIAQNGFVILEDPKQNFAAQNVVPLINSAKLTDVIREKLDAVSAALDTAALLELNTTLASPEKPDVARVAQDWVTAEGLG